MHAGKGWNVLRNESQVELTYCRACTAGTFHQQRPILKGACWGMLWLLQD